MGKLYWQKSKKSQLNNLININLINMKKNQKTKEDIIDSLKKTPIVQFACKKINISRSTLYRWKQQDKKFSERIDKAISEGNELMNDLAESQLISAIKDRNLGAIIFWLKNRHKAYAPKLKISGEIRSQNKPLSPEQKELIKKALLLSSLIPDTNKLKNKKDD